jgi:alpha-1,2-mannosyltransferase
VVAAGASTAALVALVCTNPGTFWRQTDAAVYRGAGASLWAHDGNLYTTLFGPARLPFTYPPFAAVVFSAGSHLPFLGWQYLLAVADIGLLLFAATGALRLSGSSAVFSRALLATAVCLWLEPIDQTFNFGQINLLIVALVVLDLSGCTRGRWRGIGVGVAAGIKLTALIFVPYLWLTGRRREAYGCLGFFLATVVLGAVLRPEDSARFWSDKVFKAGNDQTRVQNQSIAAFLRRLPPHGSGVEPAWFACALLVGVAGMAVAVRAHQAGLKLTGLAACAGTGLAISPLSWTHHYVYIILVISLAFSNELPKRARVALGLTASLLFAWWPWPNGNNWSGLKFHVSGLLRLVPYGSGRELHWNLLQTVAGNYYLWCVLAFLVVAHRMTSNSRDRQKQAGERPSAVGTKSEA